jgi:hypothetical protein
MKFKEQMHGFYQKKLDRIPDLPCRLPADTKEDGMFRWVPVLQDILGYSVLGVAGLHYLITGRFFMVIQDFPAIRLLF